MPNEHWRVVRLIPLGEVLSPGRITAAGVRLAIQLYLVVCLWRALYADTVSTAGMTEAQAVTYAVLAVLALRMRDTHNWTARDTVFQHVESGTIAYWFLRPLSARRYHFLRALGGQLYGLGWVAAGYAVCLAAGAVSPPASTGAGLAFAVSFLCGQSVFYYLVLLTDQMCFWTVQNKAAVQILLFAQNLLSGTYAALWFFPDWFQSMSALLPFQATLNVPLSFYVGRLPVADLPGQLAVQCAWVLMLAALTRVLWRSATRRVVSQGG